MNNENNYISIDFNKVKGFNKLSDSAKEVFMRVYKCHNSCQGAKYKEDCIPVKVKEHKSYIEVHFKNGEWLHYSPTGTWY